jgi:hypothetical protein
VFRAVVLARRIAALTASSEFPQIAAHVDGFTAEIPAAPAPTPKVPSYTGPALLGAEDRIPTTMEVRPGDGSAALGIPAVTSDGDIRPLDEIEADMIRLALGRYRGHMTEVAKRLEDWPLHALSQDAGIWPRAARQLRHRV